VASIFGLGRTVLSKPCSVVKASIVTESFDHGSVDALIRKIKDKSDDIDAIWIIFDTHMMFTDNTGNRTEYSNIAAVIQYCRGDTSSIQPAAAEAILNDEGIRRLRIPFRLLLPGQSLPRKQKESQ
jgi:hypothetical protein